MMKSLFFVQSVFPALPGISVDVDRDGVLHGVLEYEAPEFKAFERCDLTSTIASNMKTNGKHFVEHPFQYR
jgi:hypothetical protein